MGLSRAAGWRGCFVLLAQSSEQTIGRLAAWILGDETAFEGGFEDGLAYRRHDLISLAGVGGGMLAGQFKLFENLDRCSHL